MTILFPHFPLSDLVSSATPVQPSSKEERQRQKKRAALRFILDDDSVGLQNFIENKTPDLFSPDDLYKCLEKAIEFRAEKCVSFFGDQKPFD